MPYAGLQNNPGTLPLSSIGGIAVYRAWSDLDAYLSASAAGTYAVLMGPTLPICAASSDGAGNVEVRGDVDFTAGDGSEFQIGVGLDIESLDGTPVHPTLSAAGLDCSLVEGLVSLNFMRITGATQHVEALVDVAVPSLLSGQAVAIGSGNVYGGVSYGTYWARGGWRNDPPSEVAPNITLQVNTPATDQMIFCQVVQATTLNEEVLCGAISDLAGGGTRQKVYLTGFGLLTANRDVKIFCVGQSQAGFSAVYKKIVAVGGFV